MIGSGIVITSHLCGDCVTTKVYTFPDFISRNIESNALLRERHIGDLSLQAGTIHSWIEVHLLIVHLLPRW